MPPEWSIVLMHGQKLGKRVLLTSKPLMIGRTNKSVLALPDGTVSEPHASITLTDEGPELVDEKSTNGTRVNGVLRQRARLQPGDEIAIGPFTLKVFSERPSGENAAALGDWLQAAQAPSGATRARPHALPEPLAERHLAALYQVCAWLSDETDEHSATRHVLAILREAFQASEAYYYGADLKLLHAISEDGEKPAVKFAPYLAEIVQRKTDATSLPGHSVDHLQQRTGHFNYLTCALRPTGAPSDPAPFVVFARPVEWQDFLPADRVLLNAVTQIWVRGQRRSREIVALRGENQKLRGPVMIGSSARMQELRAQATRIAASHSPVLIVGETGTGKDVLAQFVHQASPRAGKPFVRVNCAAIPATLVESELFGHAKGAFTDAKTARDGRFKEADGGTLFLDELGEMPLGVQVKLLNVLESGEFEKLGARGRVKVDVRVIAATNRNLSAMAKAGEFRSDLLNRLNYLRLIVPPLRERLDDISELVDAFATAFCAAEGLAVMTFDDAARAELKRQPWDGNVRQLRAIVHACCLFADAPVIGAELVRRQVQEQAAV